MPDIEAVVRRLFSALASHDLDAVANAYTPNGVRMQNGATVRGRENIRALYGMMEEAVELADLHIGSIVVVGSTAVTEYTERGTERKPIATPFGIIAPSHAPFPVHGAAVAEFDGELIRSHRVYSDGAYQMLAHSRTSSWTADNPS